jgi:hypothetical protein
MLAAMILVLAALAAAPGCTSGGGADDVFDLTGLWGGHWEMLGQSGGLSVTLVQTGDSLSGAITIQGSPCMATATVTGTVSGETVTIGTVSGGANRYDYAGTIRSGGDEMSGTWAGFGPCAGGTAGTFELKM